MIPQEHRPDVLTEVQVSNLILIEREIASAVSLLRNDIFPFVQNLCVLYFDTAVGCAM